MKTIKELRNGVSSLLPESKWSKAVKGYCLDFIDRLEEMWRYESQNCGGSRRSDIWLKDKAPDENRLEKTLLNGASSWHEYSWGGNAVIYNGQLAKLLLNESELDILGWKRDSDGDLYGGRSEWEVCGMKTHLLDRQASALRQAFLHLSLILYGAEAESPEADASCPDCTAKFAVGVIETLYKEVTVTAKNASEALETVEEMYDNGEIVLDDPDQCFAGTRFELVKELPKED